MTSLEYRDVSFGYGGMSVLKDISLKFDKPGLICILGPNGVGKTTLVKCGNKLLRPDAGEVLLDGKDVGEYGFQELARRMAFVSAESNATFSMTVTEAILMGRHPHSGSTSDDNLAKVEEAMHILGLDDLSERDFRALSAGQAQRVKIARGLVQEPEVLVLDEPTSNLDVRHQIDVMKFLKAYARDRGILVIMVCHDLNITAAYADRVILMNDGMVFADGSSSEVLTEENIRTVYGVESKVMDVGGSPHVILIPEYD